MSCMWKPPYYGPRGRETQWIGIIFQTHSTFCGCEDPTGHLLYLLAPQLTQQQIQKFKRCLSGPTTDAATTTTTEEITTAENTAPDVVDILDGELEDLFAIPMPEDTG